jgi:hypothetical protein
LPIGAALLLRPGLTALASAVCVLLYALVALTYPDPTSVRPDALGFELTQGLFLGWMGTAATLLSVVLTRRAREIASLATSRGRLVAQALDAEDRARRRLAEALHDDALQNLLAARQLLDAGDAESAALAREGLDEGVAQIRRAVFDLHPYLLEQAGLRAALQAVAERAGRRAGFSATVEVDPRAEGLRDALLFSVARELLANAAKHSAARDVQVSVFRLGRRRARADRGRQRPRPGPRGGGGRAGRGPHRPGVVRGAGRGGRRQPRGDAAARRPRHGRPPAGPGAAAPPAPPVGGPAAAGAPAPAFPPTGGSPSEAGTPTMSA